LSIFEHNGQSRISVCQYLELKLLIEANDSRSNRDGRNLGMDDFEDAMVKAVNFDIDFILNFFTIPQFRKLGILSQDQNYTDAHIDLEDLNFHNHNEHDASMSRLDKIQGDTIHVQPALVEKILCDTVPEDYPYLNTSSIGRTRVRRENDSYAAGSGEPDFNITIIPGVAEGGLALLFLGGGVDSSDAAEELKVRKEMLKEWMDYERIPQGWKRSEKVVMQDAFTPLFDSVKSWRAHWL